MSGRQQRVLVQPIVRFPFSKLIRIYLLTICIRAERDLQKPAAGLLQHANNALYDTDMHIQRTKVVIWLYDNIEMRIEGRIIVRALPCLEHRAR
jgi:hypothetical protein